MPAPTPFTNLAESFLLGFWFAAALIAIACLAWRLL